MDYVNHKWINPKTIERRLYQETILNTAINGNTLVVLPTGLGKTPIAAMVSAYILDKDMYKKILFLAPTKPLVEQHKKSFERFLKIGPDELRIITGSIKAENRPDEYKKADIVFSTPQTIKNDLINHRLSLKDFSLLIIDEAHHSVGNYAYTYIARKYMDTSEKPLILGLTASPGSHHEKINEIKKRLFIDYVEIKTRNDADVKPYIKERDEKIVKVEMSDEQKKIVKLLKDMKDEKMEKIKKWGLVGKYTNKKQLLSLQKKISKSTSGMKYTALSIIAELIKIDYALILAETQCIHGLENYFNKIYKESTENKTRASERIASDERFMKAYNICKKLSYHNEEHPKINKLKLIVEDALKSNAEKIMIFAQYRDTIETIYKSLKDIKGAKPIEFIGQTMKSGKGLNQKEQSRILNEFKLGIYNILIASQVGEEGLDVTETDLVIFYEPIPSGIRKIQRSGRTGRTKKGNIIVMITNDTRDNAYYWISKSKEKTMTRILDNMKVHHSLKEFDNND